jgi:multidrug efflux pump
LNFSHVFITRPVATTLLTVAILLLGALTYGLLPRSALPIVEYPTIEVTTRYPGASPDVMTSAVTAPLEKQFGTMPNLSQMSSHSSAGSSLITLQFDLSLALDVAEQEVQAAINAASGFLPADLPAPPVYAKVNPADTPVLSIGITSRTLPLTDVEDLAETRVAQKLSQVPGVGLVTVQGGQRPSVRVQFNPRALGSLGLSSEDLRGALANLNLNAPKGLLEGPTQAYTIDTNDQLFDTEGYADSVIAYRNGRAIRLSDVASVVRGPETSGLGAWTNEVPALVLSVQRQPGANVIQIVDRIKAVLPDLQAALPAAVTVTLLSDRTTSIRASLWNVGVELNIAVVLVVAVILIFLRSPTATLIPSLSVPVSLLGGLAGMYFWGFSLDNLSLMALTISAGFVVDDAIIVIENISRHIEAGESPLEAALTGSREIGFTIISLTVSLLAVLIPLLFMADVIGRLFHEFAMTVAITIVISAFVSLTLVPMLCSRLLRPVRIPTGSEGPRAEGMRVPVFEGRLVGTYGRWLDWVLEHRLAVLLVIPATLGLTAFVSLEMRKGFFPEQDTGIIQAVTEAAPSVSYAAMAARQQSLVRALLADEDVAGVTSYIGIDGTNTTANSGRMLINLRPHAGRRSSADAILRRLRARTSAIVGISATLQPVQDLTVDTSMSAGQYKFILENPSASELAAWTSRLVKQLRREGALRDVASDLGSEGLGVELIVDRASAGRYGVTPAAIDNALYDAFGERIVSTIFTQSNQYRVILEASPRQRLDLSALESIYVPAAGGARTQVPLSVLVRTRTRTAPLQLGHFGRFPSATVSFNLAPRASLDAAATAVRRAEKAIGLPAGFQTILQGSLAAFESSLANELYLVMAAVVTMYIVLGVLYESFFHPLTILSTLPSAGVGALLALDFSGGELDVVAIIGIVLLIGLVKKNAIMVVDFALAAERNAGLSARAAIHRACLLRFRPILMTTLAALFAALPLILGNGVGAEMRRPLGIVIAGGLVASQLLTLFTTPVVYLAIDSLSRRMRLWGEGFATHPVSP